METKTLPVSWGWEKGVPAAKLWRTNLERRYGHRKGFMFIDVVLRNGTKSCKVRAMLDTGATMSFISSNTRHRLGNPEGAHDGWVYGVGGATKTCMVRLRACLPDGLDCEFPANILDVGFECVLGLDFMRRAEMTLHTAEERITYTKKATKKVA